MSDAAVKHTRSQSGELSRLLGLLGSSRVMVGIPADSPDRKPEPGEKKAPASNALIGYVQERGMPERNVPARPFLVPGVQGARDRITAEMRKGAKTLLETHDPSVVERTLNIVGLVAQRAAQQKITDGPFQPLKQSTIAGRLRRGRTGTSPLIDTSQLRNAITYAIRGAGREWRRARLRSPRS